MLKYKHTFNSDIDYPFHIHYIESDTSSVSINLNGIHLGYYKPTNGSLHSFDKYIPEIDMLGLMITGSRQEYNSGTYDSFFKDSSAKYIKNSNTGYFLIRNDNGSYSWSATNRSLFFYNPEYFNSKYLWEETVGYVPSGTLTNDIWTYEEARALFSPKIYSVETDWSGERIFEDVAPLVLEPFVALATGTLIAIEVDEFIYDLQELADGDSITIDNGIETLELTVANTFTAATYEAYTETTRPLAHVEIDIVNPNKKYVYSQALAVDETVVVDTIIDENQIDFTVKRIAEVE